MQIINEFVIPVKLKDQVNDSYYYLPKYLLVDDKNFSKKILEERDMRIDLLQCEKCATYLFKKTSSLHLPKVRVSQIRRHRKCSHASMSSRHYFFNS